MSAWPNYRNFIYMKDQGFIFAYVPKVACTNWKSMLRYMAGHDDWLDNKLAHDKMNGGLRYLDLQGPDAALLSRADIKKYTMVRDPYTRVLSAYLNKIEQRLPVKSEGEGDHFDKIVRDIDAFRRSVLKPDRYPSITFEVFLLWLRDSGSWFTKDEHWAPQVTLLRQPEVEFDIIGRFEDLEEDAPKILKAMGCRQQFPSQVELKFTPTGARSKVAKYFNDTTRKMSEQVFSKDFEIFGYCREAGSAVKVQGGEVAGRNSQSCATLCGRPSVNNKISEDDWMWKGNMNTAAYLDAGWSVGRTLMAAQIMQEDLPRRILDFGCGHGRVMRWLCALFPDAEIVAADRSRDAVDFCAQTFDAVPVYCNDSYEEIPLGGDFDLIWLGSVYTHLPMDLWYKLTALLKRNLASGGALAFSYAGPHVARLLIDGERNANAEVAEGNFEKLIDGYVETGFGYARHEGTGEREWGRSLISHARLFKFLHEEDMSVLLLGEKLYDNRQDIVVAQKRGT